MNRTNDSKAARWELITLGGLVILAAALRMARIEAREPWLDEACTALFASESLDRLWEILAVESHPPLYYLFMSAWTRLFGIGPLAIRSPSFLAGLVLVWLVWRGVRAFGGGRSAALLAAGACAVSPVMIYYSIEAKAYTLLWSVYLGGVLLLRAGAAGKGSRRAFIGAGLLTVIAVYTHYYGLILLLLWLPALVFAPNPARRWGFASVSVALLLYLPWVISSMGIQVNSGGTAWLAMFVEDPWTMMGRSVLIMSQVPPFPSYLGELGLIVLPTGLAVLGGMWLGCPVLAGIFGILRSAKGLKLRILLPAMLLPFVVPAVASVWRPVYLPGRYELLAYGPFLIFWGLGVEVLLNAFPAVPRLYAWLLAGILTAGAMVPSSMAFLTTDCTNPMERIGKHLEEDAPGEPVVTVGVAWAPLEYQF